MVQSPRVPGARGAEESHLMQSAGATPGGQGWCSEENRGVGLLETSNLYPSSFLFHSSLRQRMPAVLFFCTPDQLCDENEKFEFQYLWSNHSFHTQENLPRCPWQMHGRKKWDWGPWLPVWKAPSLLLFWLFNFLLCYWKRYLNEWNANYCNNRLADFGRSFLISCSYKWEESGKVNKTEKVRAMHFAGVASLIQHLSHTEISHLCWTWWKRHKHTTRSYNCMSIAWRLVFQVLYRHIIKRVLYLTSLRILHDDASKIQQLD